MNHIFRVAHLAALCFLLSLLPAVVSAEEHAFKDGAEDVGAAGDFLKEMDKDGDGLLSLAEMMPEEVDFSFKEMIRTAFEIADVDKNDKLSVTELPHAIGEFERMYPDAFQNDGSEEDDVSEEDGVSEEEV